MAQHLPKIFNDPIHGSIELHPYLVRIIDTPQFQRLRYIRQMGGVYFVYPGASHNRFEHSIGVAHLARKMVEALNEKHQGLITDDESLCVQIAALCHDLGLKNWTHEQQSQLMLEKLIRKLEESATPDDKSFHDFMNSNLDFIKELIDPPKGPKKNDKIFLYEIVSNKRTGIDVDKMDSFARDCYHLGIESNFNHKRFMKFARLIDVDGERQICMRDKEVGHIYDLFHTRNNIHHKACQHKVVRAIETMIVDAFLEADDELGISESVFDLDVYTKMTDEIFQKILKGEGGTDAQQILMRITNRDLYKCVLEIRPADPTVSLKEILQEEIAELVEYLNNDPNVVLEVADMNMKIIDMMYGMKGRNPIEDMRFYTKSNPNEATKVEQHEVSRLLPTVFAEQLIHVYCKKEKLTSAAIKSLHKATWTWMKKKPYMKTQKSDRSCEGVRKRLKK